MKIVSCCKEPQIRRSKRWGRKRGSHKHNRHTEHIGRRGTSVTFHAWTAAYLTATDDTNTEIYHFIYRGTGPHNTTTLR